MKSTPEAKQARRRGAGRAVAAAAVVAGVAIAAVSTGERDEYAPVPAASGDTVIAVIAGGPFEPSGVAHVPGSNSLLFVDDGRSTEIFMMEVGGTAGQAGAPIPIPLGADVTDLEGITTDGRHFYVIGSQSKKTGFEGDGLVRFTFDPDTRRVAGVERVRGLKEWLATNVPELAGIAGRAGDDVLNIEGLAWDPRGKRLLLGLRAPQVDGNALVIPVRLVDSAAAFSVENLRYAGPTILLALGGAGIRSLEFDAARSAFLVITGAGPNEESRDFRILEWNGESTAPTREVATFSRALKPEGFTRAVLGGRAASVIVFDVGRLTVIY